MTLNFAEQAIQYVKETDYIDDLNRNLAGNAFIAGCEHGYRVGKAARGCVVEVGCEGGIWECQRDQLKQQLEERYKAFELYRQATEENVRDFNSVAGENSELRTRLEECEGALLALHTHGSAVYAANYFTKHPPDSAKGDL